MNIGDFWLGAAFGGVVAWVLLSWARKPTKMELFRDDDGLAKELEESSGEHRRGNSVAPRKARGNDVKWV